MGIVAGRLFGFIELRRLDKGQQTTHCTKRGVRELSEGWPYNYIIYADPRCHFGCDTFESPSAFCSIRHTVHSCQLQGYLLTPRG